MSDTEPQSALETARLGRASRSEFSVKQNLLEEQRSLISEGVLDLNMRISHLRGNVTLPTSATAAIGGRFDLK